MLNPRTRDMMAWNGAAVFLGGALPMLLMGRAVMAVWLVLGIVFGLFAVGRKLWQGSLWRSAVMTRGVALSAAMLGALFLSAVFSIDVGYSMGRFGELLGLALGALLLFVVLREMPGRSLHLSIKVMAICTVGAILLVLADAFSDSQRLSAALHGRKWDQVHRLNYMSSVLAVLLPYLWVWLLKRARDQEPLALLFALPISLVGFFAVFVCGGRAGWAAVFVAAVLLLWLGGRWHGVVLHTRHWVALPVFLALGPIGYGLSRGWDVMLERILVWREQMGAMSGRGDIWAHAWNHVGDNWLTGIGINAFRKLPVPFEPFPSNAHPHNFVLQLLLETGLVGTAAAFALIGAVMLYLWRHAQVNLWGLAGLCSLVAFWVASLANTSIFQPWWLVFFIVSTAFALRLCRQEAKHV